MVLSEAKLSDIDSESDSESSHIEFKSLQTGNNQHRRKRRGIIEKRRRDRINQSLTELRRLVPAAFEKQGSAKLEKAEILQLTVNHLKSLQNKGPEKTVESSRAAVDYRNMGYRECLAEVARYLISVEGLDSQDPMRVRLLRHLHGTSAQREASLWTSTVLSSNSTSQSMLHHESNTAAFCSVASPQQYESQNGDSLITEENTLPSHHQTIPNNRLDQSTSHFGQVFDNYPSYHQVSCCVPMSSANHYYPFGVPECTSHTTYMQNLKACYRPWRTDLGAY